MASIPYNATVTCATSVKDMAASIDWYVDKLGFELDYRLDDIGWCELRSPVPGVTVGLSQVEEVPNPGGAVLTWGVTDIDAARAELEGKGVRFDGETRTIPDMVKLATFFDPDENTYMLAQTLMAG